MQNRRGLFAGMQSGRLSGFVPYKGTKDLPNAGRISRFIRNFVDMKVALCQFSMEWEAAARNLRRAEELVAQAGADLALLPEMFATGFVTEPWRTALPDEEELLAWMRRTARRYATALAGSAVVRSGDRFANRRSSVTTCVFRSGVVVAAITTRFSAWPRGRRRVGRCGGPCCGPGRSRTSVMSSASTARATIRGTIMPAIRRSSISRGRRSARRTLRRGSSRPGSTGKRSIGSGRNFPHGATPTISCCDDCARNAVCGKIATFAGNLFRSGRAASRQSPAGLGLTLGLHCLCTIFRMQDAI